VARRFLDDHLIQWAGALAFFAALSLFPSLLALVSVLGLIGASAVEPLIQNVGALAPGTARDVALEALRSIEARGGAARSPLDLGWRSRCGRRRPTSARSSPPPT
jgi:membrane protein